MAWILRPVAVSSICSTLIQQCLGLPVDSDCATSQDQCWCGRDEGASVPVDRDESRSDFDTGGELPYTCSRNGSFVTINITSGNMAGEVIAFDVDKVWRNTLHGRQDQFVNGKDAVLWSEEPPEEEIPPNSYHGPHGRQISKEEYERAIALEEFHVEQGTLHLLYPNEYEEGYSIPQDYHDDEKEDQDGNGSD